MRWLGALLLVGCGGTSFTGNVVDHVGAPVPEASVAVVGQLCTTRADETGHFDLSCSTAKGKTTLSVGQIGYLSDDVTTEVVESESNPVGTLTLIAIPEGEGLFLRTTTAEYSQPERGYMVKSVVEKPYLETSFCIKEDTPANTIPAGELTLFDKRHEGWRIWVVEDGCVYKKERHGPGNWTQTFGDKIDASLRELGNDQRIGKITLETGSYFITEWKKGFFAPDKSVKGSSVHYGGYLLTVE